MALIEDTVGVFAALTEILGFADGHVVLEFRAGYVEGVEGEGVAPGEAHVFGVEGLVELGVEVIAEGDEGVEDAVVSGCPRGDDGGAEDGGDGCSGEVAGEAGFPLSAAQHP